ncbi:signal peptidase I [Candidatus Bathyarchaeota archaeon]|nr:MAG: signal peptidase I [Candidatus Bathyarchaeota archaeon]
MKVTIKIQQTPLFMRLKTILKNIFPVLLILSLILAFWFSLSIIFSTSQPILAVTSESMKPTLNVGDLIVVKGVSIGEVLKDFNNGVEDIIVFYAYTPNNLKNPTVIVHRVVGVVWVDGKPYLKTKGDNNPIADPWLGTPGLPEENLVGKVVAVIPMVGWLILFFKSLYGVFIISLCLAFYIFTLIFRARKAKRIGLME